MHPAGAEGVIMNFTANELQNIVFRKSPLGFHQNQVYEVVQRVVEDYSAYIRENVKLKEKNEEMLEKLQYYKSIESALQSSLIIAQQTSEDVVSNAKKQAENIVAEANVRALEIVDHANRQVSGTLFEKERLQHELEAFRIRTESLLQAQIRLIQGLNADEPEREPYRKTGRESLSVVGK